MSTQYTQFVISECKRIDSKINFRHIKRKQLTDKEIAKSIKQKYAFWDSLNKK